MARLGISKFENNFLPFTRDKLVTHRLCRSRGSGGVQLMDRDQSGGLTTLTLIHAAMGVDVQISFPFSGIKHQAPSSWSIFVGENKFLDQGTVLLNAGEDATGCPVCAPKGTIGATEPAPWLPGVKYSF